ncbi:DUF2637 domain-containing protein [Streptomyces sp. NBC_00258]|uniref:DUF2637 domain-containing protein n=1 Tax=Streptomyces sp. NBC_00258 TaxID=2903642 RepID=UPI002E2A598E|nr:DUF2637 domain-containing protein [Streptomyces sp. NBC_00258]
MTTPHFTAIQRRLVITVASGAVVIAAIGFLGSYAAVRELALDKGFGDFAMIFPIGIDAGILVLLALDLLLTWIRIPFPLLRHTAWLLTTATIAFNGASAWPDPLGVGMHAVIPILFVVVTEAARHAIGRIADITADKHMDSVRLSRWLLAPWSTFLLWRRMKLWELRSYEQVIALERQRLVARARLRAEHGWRWRWTAPFDDVMALRLTRYGRALGEPITAPNIERLPVAVAANTAQPAIETSTFQAAADQAIDVVREPETDDREQPNAVANTEPSPPNKVREQIANKASTSANTDREQPVMADVVREQIRLHTENSAAVLGVLANIPDANKASVAAAVRRERRKAGPYL